MNTCKTVFRGLSVEIIRMRNLCTFTFLNIFSHELWQMRYMTFITITKHFIMLENCSFSYQYVSASNCKVTCFVNFLKCKTKKSKLKKRHDLFQFIQFLHTINCGNWNKFNTRIPFLLKLFLFYYKIKYKKLTVHV